MTIARPKISGFSLIAASAAAPVYATAIAAPIEDPATAIAAPIDGAQSLLDEVAATSCIPSTW